MAVNAQDGKDGGHYGIGFGGSDFKTPVDVHHEEEVHLKVCTKSFI